MNQAPARKAPNDGVNKRYSNTSTAQCRPFWPGQKARHCAVLVLPYRLLTRSLGALLAGA